MDGVENASENGLGVEYKLRAVQNDMGGWHALIRDGISGKLLTEDSKIFETSEEALSACVVYSDSLSLHRLQKKIGNNHMSYDW